MRCFFLFCHFYLLPTVQFSGKLIILLNISINDLKPRATRR